MFTDYDDEHVERNEGEHTRGEKLIDKNSTDSFLLPLFLFDSLLPSAAFAREHAPKQHDNPLFYIFIGLFCVRKWQ